MSFSDFFSKLITLVLTTGFILSMIIHLLWEQRVAGSNPVIPIL